MKPWVLLLLTSAGLFAAEEAPRPPQGFTRIIPAFPVARRQQRVLLAEAAEAQRLGLGSKDILVVRAAGQTYPVQWDERSKEPYFVLPYQAKEQAVEIQLEPVESWQPDRAVEHAYVDDHFWMTTVEGAASKRLFGFQHDEALPPGIKPVYRRGGFIHPVLTPAGEVISGSFAPDHAHHHGIWTAWSHTAFQGRKPDFWNVHEETGRVDYVGLGNRWIGWVDSGFHARMRSLDTKAEPPVEVLAETWKVTTFVPRADQPMNIFELETSQRNVAKDALELTKHIYGGLGYRGLATWTATAPLTFLTSEGQVGRKAGDGQRVRWFCFGGPTEHGRGGIAILGHPTNPNAPQWTRFNPKDPFVAFTPVHDGSLTVKPDETLTQRFRFLVYDGEPDAQVIEEHWQGFAHPARAVAK